ncbi:hypothetical protein BO99DRAFT_402043 [Aspergillus violaceofuscus CBS 115571]|uniref:Uncharacterized protein n=1 Tax=Aspergillus violaceofuscus (strain CBS 115571) TaxID=1450538 RepID=A0A2V5H7N2_ASPV1|nr:hypothetical protein BO99DRAFT_402043 [Aspergillus violaceofuscus CBS 115571]
MSPRLDPTTLDLSTKSIPARESRGTYLSSTVIRAPATDAWDAVVNTGAWSTWNTFCPGATIREQPDQRQSTRLHLGTKMTIHLNWNPRGPKTKPADVALVVTEFDPPKDGRQTPARIAWATDPSGKGLPSWLLYAERVHEFHEFVEEATDGETEGQGNQRVTQVVSWESQRGPLAYVVKWFMGKKFRACLQVQAEDLTAFVLKGGEMKVDQ